MTKDWWGYDRELDTWVYLDRSILNNKPTHAHLPLIFDNCSDETIYEVATNEWSEPRFIYEKIMLPEDDFPNIRAMNDHGCGREIEGITRSAYRLVCELINLQNGFGAPLLQSRKY